MRTALVHSRSSILKPRHLLPIPSPVAKGFRASSPLTTSLSNLHWSTRPRLCRSRDVTHDRSLLWQRARWLSDGPKTSDGGREILSSSTSAKTPPTNKTQTGSACDRAVADAIFSSSDVAKPGIPLSGPSSRSTEQLPSEHFNRRSNLSAKLNRYMESLLNSLALLSQRLNVYTGTDYSGISALRNSITSQEIAVRSRYIAVDEAKEAHAAALAAQAASHKEVVKLLERKHSWSDGDLEHYMALVRSEHLNEQAVQAAKDGVAEAERFLEEGRVTLEKIERKQYHEEQIWSDTIRRNSTWVTFGLMGVNILLLLASLMAIEPWRRKRMVREIRSALEERSLASQVHSPMPVEPSAKDDAQITIEHLPLPLATQPLQDSPNVAFIDSAASRPPSDQSAGVEDFSARHSTTGVAKFDSISSQPSNSSKIYADTWSNTFALWNAYWIDLFSERRIALRRVDLTAATLEGAAAGAAFMGVLFVLLRPH